VGSDGSRGPLPKQKVFLNSALDLNGPKYVAYVGGLGSGKSLIGCITVLTWAVMYQGDYLIARQYAPELSVTTYKTFLEICPPSLIVEHRVADRMVKIKSRGGVSTVLFRQLEEPDKHRSLNLNAFYIDEASQCSAKAFEILQGRLRGKHVRKGIITSNPNGHDWIYNNWVRQDGFKEEAKKMFSLIKAPSTENVHLPDGYVQSMLTTWSEDKIRREIYGDFDSFAGQVYSEFRRDIHVIKPFVIPKEWTRIVGIDHGYKNPAAWCFVAVDYDGNLFVYKEYYQKDTLIENICKDVTELMRGENISEALIDPSTTARRGQSGFSDYDHYVENLPAGFPLKMAKNDVPAGIERVKQFLKVDLVTNKPSIFIFDTCYNLLDEITQYRYPELMSNQVGKKPEDENPIKVNDHILDALRYAVMSRPETIKSPDDVYNKIKYNSLEGALYRDLQKFKKPAVTDPFGF
jgi:PBSX family phage terminase large subunit